MKINQLEHVWDVMKKSKNDLIRIVKNKMMKLILIELENWMEEELTYVTTSNA